MTDRFYLHVGAPKAGTTYLQRVLEANHAGLADQGVTVIGPRLDLIHAAMVVREDRRLADLPAEAAQAWSRVVDAVRASSTPIAIASYELFAGASAEQVTAALDGLMSPGGPEVHVVITARDLGRAVPSAWQEQLKFAGTTPLETWRPKPDTAGPRAEWGWRTMDPAAVAARWSAAVPAERIHVVTLPRHGSDDELWQRFARACGVPELAVHADVGRANESLGAAQAELLRRVNAHLGDQVVGPRARSVWIRDLLAHRVLARQEARRPIGVTDVQLDDARSRALAAVAAIREAGYDVQGDLDDLVPEPWDGVLPGSVTDAELLEAAVQAVADLVLQCRDHAADAATGGRQTSSEDPDEPGGGRAARLARTVLGAPGRRQVDDLRARIAALEAQVQAERGLHLRVAELSDVVADLLLPATVKRRPVRRRAVMGYRRRSL